MSTKKKFHLEKAADKLLKQYDLKEALTQHSSEALTQAVLSIVQKKESSISEEEE